MNRLADNHVKRLDFFVKEMTKQPFNVNNNKLLNPANDKFFKFKAYMNADVDQKINQNMIRSKLESKIDLASEIPEVLKSKRNLLY